MRIIAIAAVAAAVAAPAFAQPPAGAPDPAARFAAMDTNKDGKVSKEEFVATLPEQAKGMIDQFWPRLDTNSDGFLSKEELAAMPGRRGG